MPRYFFHCRSADETIPDDAGAELTDTETARILHEIWSRGWSNGGRRIGPAGCSTWQTPTARFWLRSPSPSSLSTEIELDSLPGSNERSLLRESALEAASSTCLSGRGAAFSGEGDRPFSSRMRCARSSPRVRPIVKLNAPCGNGFQHRATERAIKPPVSVALDRPRGVGSFLRL